MQIRKKEIFVWQLKEMAKRSTPSRKLLLLAQLQKKKEIGCREEIQALGKVFNKTHTFMNLAWI